MRHVRRVCGTVASDGCRFGVTARQQQTEAGGCLGTQLDILDEAEARHPAAQFSPVCPCSPTGTATSRFVLCDPQDAGSRDQRPLTARELTCYTCRTYPFSALTADRQDYRTIFPEDSVIRSDGDIPSPPLLGK